MKGEFNMTAQVSMALLAICAVMTSLITQALKKMLLGKAPTVLAAIVSVVVGIAIPVGYLILNSLPFTPQDIVYIISLVVLTWLCSTLGYDTVLTALAQLGGAGK